MLSVFSILSAATLADISCDMYNTSLPFNPDDRTSSGFVKQQGKFCQDVSRTFLNEALAYPNDFF